MPLEPPVRFTVLGAVRVCRGDAELDLGGPQERAFLALLLVGAGRPVAVGEIVDALWGAEPPRSAVNVVRRHVGSLRRLLEPGLAARAEGRWLVRDAGGYRLVTDGDSSDLLRFRALREQARRMADRAPAPALELLVEALSLWRGPLAVGIPARSRAHPAFDAVDRERLAAVRQAADAALRAGRPDAVLPELRAAAARHPLDEPLQAGLLLALAAVGHRSEALAAYEAVRARLAEELGIDPGAELRDARDAVLHAVPGAGVRHSESDLGVLGALDVRGRRGAQGAYDAQDAVAGAHPGRGAGAGVGMAGGTGGGTGTGTDAGTGAGTGADAGTGAGAGAGAGTGDGRGADRAGGADAGAGVGTGTDSGAGGAGAESADGPVQAPVAPGQAGATVQKAAPPPLPFLPPPAQLPHDNSAFTGRRAELDEAFALSGVDGSRPGTVVISAIGGMAGVGKTTLAVHWAHRVADRFPDGQLYVNLRGFDPSGAVMDPGEAVRGSSTRSVYRRNASRTGSTRRPRSTAACSRAAGSSSCWTTRVTASRCGRCCRARRAA